MKEIGEYLKTSREEKGISIEEASEDLKLDVLVLEQIELGNKDIFKDIYELRSCVQAYSKYLCLDTEKISEEFNDFMFEYTSKIPIVNIDNEVKEEIPSKKVVSPYTMEESLKRKSHVKTIAIIVGITLIIAIVLLIIL